MEKKRVEVLLEHAAFVRALARRLVRDEATADDVAQQTWLAALQQPPVRKPRAWLGAVVRNVVSRMARAERRRLRRERAAARAERVGSTADRVTREELLRSVTDALLALPAQYREAVLMRFYEDLAPRQIARRLKIPVETVRSRVRRGVAKLRDLLDEKHGRRSAWLPVLAVLAFPQRTGAATAALKGAFSISTKTKVGVAAGLALAAATAAWQLTGDPAPQPFSRTGDEARRATAAGKAVEPRPGAAPVAAADPAAAGPYLIVRVLDPTGAEVAGATINGVQTGEDGTCRLALDAAQATIELTGHAPGRPRQRLGIVPTWRRGVVVTLYPARALRGRVIDEERRPVAGARVFLDENPWDDEKPLATSTGPDGGFSFHGRPPCGWPLRAHVAAFHERGAVVERLRSIPGNGDVVLELQLEAAVRSVTGRVVDLQDAPVAGAEVTLATAGLGPRLDLDDARTTTDAGGRFSFPPWPRRALRVAQVFVRQEGYGAGVAGVGPDDVQVTLAPYCRLRGRVAWDDGTPVPDLVVDAVPAPLTGNAFSPLLGRWPGMTAKTDARGEFVLDRLPAAQPFRTEPEAPKKTRFRLTLRGDGLWFPQKPRFVRTPAGEETAIVVTLPRPQRTVAFVVAGPDGKAVPHTHVGVTRGDWFGMVRVGPGGRGELGLYGSGDTMAIDLTSSRFGRRRLEDVAIDDEVALRFHRAPLRVRGVVVDAAGAPVRDAQVWIGGTYDGTTVDPATGTFALNVNADLPYVLAIRRGGREQRHAGVRPEAEARLVWREETSTLADLVVRTEGDPEGIAVLGLENGIRRTRLAAARGRTVFRLPEGRYSVRVSYAGATAALRTVDAPGEVLVRLGAASAVTGTLTAPGGVRAFPCLLELRDAETGALAGRWQIDHRGEVSGPRIGRGRYRGRIVATSSGAAYPLARVLTADGEAPLDATATLQAAGRLEVSIRWGAEEPPRFLVVRHAGDVIRRVPVTGVELAGRQPLAIPDLAPGEYEVQLAGHRRRTAVAAGAVTEVAFE